VTEVRRYFKVNVIGKIGGVFRGAHHKELIGELQLIDECGKKLFRELADVRQHVMECRRELADVRQHVMECRRELADVRQHVRELRSESTHNKKGLLALRYHIAWRPNERRPSEAKLKELVPISEQYEQLKQLAAHAYSAWRPLLEMNKAAYEGLPLDSCSVGGHPMATLFRFFLAPYLRGRVLDIGCGPQPVPVYLEDHPVEALYGIDPLGEPDEHPFHFSKGLAEFLPWVDRQFNTVVAATTLDHVLLLDKVFEEVVRVLSDDGIFVVWVSFFPGAEPYDPYQKSVEKVDDYHLFHFDREWFLKAIEPFFTLFEEFTFDPPETSSFLALRPRKQGINYFQQRRVAIRKQCVR
jgi:SAM-dependent methyltransferase